jgi:hypothetical protein
MSSFVLSCACARKKAYSVLLYCGSGVGGWLCVSKAYVAQLWVRLKYTL